MIKNETKNTKPEFQILNDVVITVKAMSDSFKFGLHIALLLHSSSKPYQHSRLFKSRVDNL